VPTILAVIMRLAAEAARGDLTAARTRLVRSIAVLSIIIVLAAVALALGLAALTIALGHWMGIVPALVSIATVATITALILALMISTRARKPAPIGLGLLNFPRRTLPRIDPLTVVVAALAIGLLLGRRRG
jgi:hypothetical protein